MKIETAALLTIKNYALKQKVTPSYIYKLIKAKQIEGVVIDGVQFVDALKYPSIK